MQFVMETHRLSLRIIDANTFSYWIGINHLLDI